MRLITPVPALPRCLGCARQGRADHHRIRAQSQRLHQVTGTAEPAVGNHMNIPSTGFVQIVRTGRSNIGNSGCHRRRNAQPLTGGHRGTAAEPHQNTGGTGAHQVLRLGVPCHAADHNRHIQLVNEFLEVQRFMRGRNMLCRDRSTANHEKIGTGLHHRFVMFLGVLRGK